MNRIPHYPGAVSDAVHMIGVPACVCDSDGLVMVANGALRRWLGFDPAGRGLAELFAAEGRAAAQAQLRALDRDGVSELNWESLLLAIAADQGAGPEPLAVQVCLKALPGAGIDGAALASVVLNDISGWRRDQAALRKRLQDQQAIQQNAAVGIVFTKSDVIQECNLRAAEIHGYRRDQIEGFPSAKLFPSAAEHQNLLAQANPPLAKGQSFSGELQFRRGDGSLFWARVNGRAVDPLNAENGTVWIVEDISAARQTRLEIEAIMTNATIGIAFARDRRLLRFNRGFTEMFRYPDEEALGMPTRVLYRSQDSYDHIGKQAYAALAKGKSFQSEAEMLRKDGSALWAQMIAYPINPDDASVGSIWIIEDRTEQKQDERTLKNALLENQAILDSAVLGIAVVENGRNLRSNRKMEELFGHQPGQVTGLPVRALYPDDAAWQQATRGTALDFQAGRVHTSEHLLVRKDGSRFWARLSGRPLDPGRRHGPSVWVVDDVTTRREAAEAVRRARDELELRVQERTAELAGANALLQGEIAERRQAEARVHHMAYHDSLTGLPNRALLSDRLDRALRAAQRSSAGSGPQRLALMFLDLDRFKTINDSLGHLTGDHLLKEVASRLCRAVRASDTVARLGGDEFVVLLPAVRGNEEAVRVADKIIAALADAIPFEGRALHITPSIGISTYPEDGSDAATLMRHADAAMYHAKSSGRNNYQFYSNRLNLDAARHFELESSLRGALAQHQFELHYQPIMDSASRSLSAMEVLLRWRRPGQGLVMPDQFIPLIEENGQIVAIGEWVIRRACEQSVAWQKQGYAPVTLAVNLSARQFMHRGLLESIRRILDDTGIDPALLEFEITETALMQHGEQTLEILGQINRMGIRLSIDDFGTGYSSLAYLKRFPVRKIKIDRVFVKELEQSAEDRAIVAAIVALSSSLQLSVVAEGVETEGQFALLRDSGCRYAQGYLFSRPLPQAAAELLLTRA